MCVTYWRGKYVIVMTTTTQLSRFNPWIPHHWGWDSGKNTSPNSSEILKISRSDNLVVKCLTFVPWNVFQRQPFYGFGLFLTNSRYQIYDKAYFSNELHEIL
ncbi:hypothetical protein CEXT_183441 [Caerostris extrusa]|uniref:Uncharacterized protein n=1 Tax=Caerostris extrusa TaxID=172846 RepID=A0AAV4MNG1_CAEEX|nr:hypothetical protein CEXT_183441 [Caerostris extrusa]